VLSTRENTHRFDPVDKFRRRLLRSDLVEREDEEVVVLDLAEILLKLPTDERIELVLNDRLSGIVGTKEEGKEEEKCLSV
jgi:hypothetical protein